MTVLIEQGILIAFALAGAALLALFIRGLGSAIQLLPTQRAARARAWLPIVGAALSLFYVGIVLRWFVNNSRVTWLIPIALFVICVGAAWSALRDAFDGLVIRSSEAYRIGDLVQIGEVEGQVAQLGWRYIVLETRDGTVATIPYSRLSRDIVQRSPRSEYAHFHVFRVGLPELVPIPEAKRAIRRALLLSPWCLYRRDPQVRVLGDQLEVVVGLVDADHEAEAEALTRSTLSRLTRRVSSAPNPVQ